MEITISTFLSLLRSLVACALPPGLRPGLHSFAARRLGRIWFQPQVPTREFAHARLTERQFIVDVPSAPMFSLHAWNCVRIPLPARG